MRLCHNRSSVFSSLTVCALNVYRMVEDADFQAAQELFGAASNGVIFLLVVPSECFCDALDLYASVGKT